MTLTYSAMLELGTELPVFKLPNTIDGQIFNSKFLSNNKGKLIMFICNHCPFVIHNHQQICEISNEFTNDIDFVAISSNDIESYPDDAPDKMQELVTKLNWNFPYLYDESQLVAKSFNAACTPEFYLFDNDDKLIYRGRIDDSSPTNNNPSTGKDLRDAINNFINNSNISELQYPSMGCNIKWKNS